MNVIEDKNDVKFTVLCEVIGFSFFCLTILFGIFIWRHYDYKKEMLGKSVYSELYDELENEYIHLLFDNKDLNEYFCEHENVNNRDYEKYCK